LEEIVIPKSKIKRSLSQNVIINEVNLPVQFQPALFDPETIIKNEGFKNYNNFRDFGHIVLYDLSE
jgi:hypothetical protein